ncbi:MAG: symmetrical bis(5'-nucleosyl)-tetraphosphatase [Proteobacteria bacterium]|nr:symmetrical bis(5'-nucleosyl)-tetraphosphatase [Pseudomonadota bacterium]
MSTFVIGDVQGCYDDLMLLLKEIKFKINKDQLIFCGDLVNRGGQSLKVLRWIYQHRENCQVTLGNHDLSLLAQYYIPKFRKSRNLEFKKIFKAKDCELLMNWLCNQKLLLPLKKYNSIIVHAGIYPSWSKKTAIKEAKRLEKKLSKHRIKFFKNMYGAKPNHWKSSLKGTDRTRFAINAFTRMRFLYKNSGLNFKAKGEVDDFPKLIPWFHSKKRTKIKPLIIFGHWSALELNHQNNTLCLDTGKVWGGKLTAVKLKKSGFKIKHIYQV